MKRIILLIILALEGIGGILGGSFLAIAPDGRLMKIPVSVMHGTFSDFFIPGLILMGLGILCLIAFFTVFFKSKIGWIMTSISLIGFFVWFSVEIAILRELHLLHIVWGTPVLIGIWAALPLIHQCKR